MNNRHFREIFEEPFSEFKSHLENPANSRILFSGRYGMGKTSFLNYFFNRDNQLKHFESENYTVFRLSPVNYAISTNEDIIRYIKYDLITQLLLNKSWVNETTPTILQSLPAFLQRNLDDVLYTIIKMIPKIGKEVTDAYDSLKELAEKFKVFHDKATTTDGDILVSYLEQFEKAEGCNYENDVITRLITETIKANSVHSILLIDDVDRLDPEHLFRILNVFAAHFDSPGNPSLQNKFGFTKVIIVCDFHNVRNIFHHRYGHEADFMGYIDKFYSSDIYHFDNRKAVQSVIQKILTTLQPSGDNQGQVNVTRQRYIDDGFLVTFLTLLVDKRFISLRNLIHLFEKNVSYHHELVQFDLSNTQVYAERIPILYQLKLACIAVGDLDKLRKIISICEKKKLLFWNVEYTLGLLIYIVTYRQHQFRTAKEHQVKYKGFELNIKPVTQHGNRIERVEVERFQNDRSLVKFIPEDDFFWSALDDTMEVLSMLNYIN